MTRITIRGVPRTKKNHQQVVMRGKKPLIVQRDAYRAYEELALWQLPHPREPIRGPVNVKCVYYMPTKRRVDLLNLLAATMDILVKGRVLEDDNSKVVYGHDVRRIAGGVDYKVTCEQCGKRRYGGTYEVETKKRG